MQNNDYIFNEEFDSIFQKYFILKKYLLDNEVYSFKMDELVIFYLPLLYKKNKGNKKLIFMFLALNLLMDPLKQQLLDIEHQRMYKNMQNDLGRLIDVTSESDYFKNISALLYELLPYKKEFTKLLTLINNNELSIANLTIFKFYIEKNRGTIDGYEDDKFDIALNDFLSSLFLLGLNTNNNILVRDLEQLMKSPEVKAEVTRKIQDNFKTYREIFKKLKK